MGDSTLTFTGRITRVEADDGKGPPLLEVSGDGDCWALVRAPLPLLSPLAKAFGKRVSVEIALREVEP